MQNTWDTEEVFFDGDDYFNRLIADIQDAKSYISIEMYIFNYDQLGKKIAEHLTGAADRGVEIEIIVDGIGSYLFFDELAKVFSHPKIKVRMYNPLPFYHPYYGEISFIKKLEVILLRLWRMNSRDHRKIITIDQHIMYAGSYNFTAEHTKFSSGKAWKDMGVRVSGRHVQFAVLNFKKIWKLREYYKYKKKIKNSKIAHWKHFPLRLNQTLFMRRYFYKNLLNKINKSQTRIWLTTPYFIPKRQLIRAIGNAAKRGVDVRVLISSKTDVPMFQTLQYFYYPYLLKKGVKVFHYSDTVLHAKNFIIDNWMTVGSSNLNHRSIMHDLEFDLVITSKDNISLIQDDFTKSAEPKNKITIHELKNRSLTDKFLSRLFFLMKYWF